MRNRPVQLDMVLSVTLCGVCRNIDFGPTDQAAGPCQQQQLFASGTRTSGTLQPRQLHVTVQMSRSCVGFPEARLKVEEVVRRTRGFLCQ